MTTKDSRHAVAKILNGRVVDGGGGGGYEVDFGNYGSTLHVRETGGWFWGVTVRLSGDGKYVIGELRDQLRRIEAAEAMLSGEAPDSRGDES